MISRRLALLGGLSAAGCATTPRPMEYISDDEYAIINMAVDSGAFDYSGWKLLLGRTSLENTEPFNNPDDDLGLVLNFGSFPGMINIKNTWLELKTDIELIDAFFEINRRPLEFNSRKISARFDKLVNAEEIGLLKRKIYDETLSLQILQFSRFAVNAERSSALGYVLSTCGGLCDSGIFILANRNSDGQWKTPDLVVDWVS